jgi:hypothetical protein
MRSHISVHVATTKYSFISFICKNKIEKEGLPKDSPAGLGAGGPEFKSRRPDQQYRAHFVGFIETALHHILTCGFLLGRRSRLASHSILMTLEFGVRAKNGRRQECQGERTEWTWVRNVVFREWGENWGDS